METATAATSSIKNHIKMDHSATVESGIEVAKQKTNDGGLLDSDKEEEAYIQPLVRKHSNDPNKLVSTSLLRKLGEVDVVQIEEEKSKDLSLGESEGDEGAAQDTRNEKQDADNGDGSVSDNSINSNSRQPTSRQSNKNSSTVDRPNLSDGPKSESKSSSFRMDWTMEQMNTSFGHRSWFRECLDSINHLRYHCGMFVNNQYVQLFVIVLITVNAIMMGLATFDFIKEDPQLSAAFETTDQVFLVIFTLELFLQLVYHGWRLLLDGWLVFDLIIILTSWSFAEVQIIRAFRIFRALRLVTRIKILKNLILALFGVMPRMAAIGLMLCLIFYIFGVMFTQLFKDLYAEGFTEYNYFSGLSWTFFTLFQMMTLDNWASICREVTKVYKWAWLPFTTFVIISGFIVVNLIIAVICDAIGALHADEKAKLHGDFDEDNTDAGDADNMDIREQLDTLEDQMEDLTRIQARTFHTLQYLTQQMQMHKIKQELQSKSFADAAKQLKKAQGQQRQKSFDQEESLNMSKLLQESGRYSPKPIADASIEIATLKDG